MAVSTLIDSPKERRARGSLKGEAGAGQAWKERRAQGRLERRGGRGAGSTIRRLGFRPAPAQIVIRNCFRLGFCSFRC